LTFGAKTSGSDDLKAIISAISTLVEEATFVATAEGITFRGMDPSHVALIDISWPNSAFEKYECDSDIKFGVRIDEFSKLIKRADKKDSIEISISEQNMLQLIHRYQKFHIIPKSHYLLLNLIKF
jgi:proliferating cell nuclear antigen